MLHMGFATRGFVLGKFAPPHKGHVFMCEAAAELVDEMTVLVCSIDAEPIPGALRAAWMRQLLPRLNVRHMHRDIPQTPDEHADFWPIWKAAIAEFHPQPIDRVFGSEPYVFRLAEELGADPVLIDPAREIHAVSSTAVLGDPAANWAQIPDVVRPYFQARVCILGPESSGKSMLAAALSERFGTVHMPEYGRTYDAHYRQGQGWSDDDFLAIARTHSALRDVLSREAGPVLIEDTDPLQTAVWAEYLLGRVCEPLEAFIATMAPPDLYLLLSADVAWLDDGTRYSGDHEVRRWFFERCRSRLQAQGCRFVEIDGASWSEREALAVSSVESLTRSHDKT